MLLTGYDPAKAPYKISITAVGGKVINTCHVTRNDLGCLQPAPQVDDDCDYYEFHGDKCTVAVGVIPAS